MDYVLPSSLGHANGFSARGSELREDFSAYRLTLFSAKIKLEDFKSMGPDHCLQPM